MKVIPGQSLPGREKCSVSPAKQVLVLADATGAELFTLDFGGQTVAVGQRISLAGRDCEVTRRREGVVLGRWPLLENDWLHRSTEVSTNVELNAGWHPIRVEWFNGALAADLAVSHAEPDGPRVVVPDSALARAVTNDAVAEPGLNYVCYEGGWVARLRDWPEALPVSRRQISVVKAFREK